MPPVLERFLNAVPALHEVVVFLTVRVVPVPNVRPEEQLLLRRLRFNGFYHVVARYGYMDAIDHGEAFVDCVVRVSACLPSPVLRCSRNLQLPSHSLAAQLANCFLAATPPCRSCWSTCTPRQAWSI